MLKQLTAGGAFGLLLLALAPGSRPVAPSPADGHTIHVLAPHVVSGHVQGPYHHYCKVISPEPVIECLIYTSTDSTARLTQIAYIVWPPRRARVMEAAVRRARSDSPLY